MKGLDSDLINHVCACPELEIAMISKVNGTQPGVGALRKFALKGHD